MELSGLTPLPSVKVRTACPPACYPTCTLRQQPRNPPALPCCPPPLPQVKPPRVKESAVHMECQLRHTYEVEDKQGAVTGTIVIGEVVMMHVHEGVAGALALRLQTAAAASGACVHGGG